MNNITNDELAERFDQHELWLTSSGRNGQQFVLEGVDLSNFNLAGLSELLVRVNLNHSNLAGSRLSHIDFTEASLRYTDLSETELHKAQFYKADLIEAKFHRIKSVGVKFTNANLRRAEFYKTDILQAGFSYTDMRGISLIKTDLSRSIFRGTDLRQAILQDVNLQGAFFSGTRMFGTDMSDIQGLDTIRLEWIDIGKNEPTKLEGDEARSWLRQAAQS